MRPRPAARYVGTIVLPYQGLPHALSVPRAADMRALQALGHLAVNLE